MADAFLRIGDPERSAATERLEGHLRAGRLTPEDFKRRVQRIATCRTVRDLDQVMVGFQQVAHQPDLGDLGSAMQAQPEGAASRPSTHGSPQGGPGWYEVLDPWDKPLGQSPLTLRKARRIGWVLAIAMSVFTATPISFLLPAAIEALVIFSPILLMIVVSFWMAPSEKKTYRWVASPQDGKPIPSPALASTPADLGLTGGGVPPVMATGDGGIPVAPPLAPPMTPPMAAPMAPVGEPVAEQPTPWTVDGPTFPTVGEVQRTPFDQDEPA